MIMLGRENMIRKILLSIIICLTILLAPTNWSAFAENPSIGTKVPDLIVTDLEFVIVSSSNILIAIKYHPTEEIMTRPPEFVFEMGEVAGECYYSWPVNYDNEPLEDKYNRYLGV